MRVLAPSLGLAALMSSVAFAADIQTRQISFENAGATLVGTLYLPTDHEPGESHPGVVVTGAWTSVKEQMSGLYAREMASRGFTALAFDFRGWGSSGGHIRFKEDPAAKTSDIVAAASFMTTLPEVDGSAVFGLSTCASAGYMTAAATGNTAFDGIVLVAPWLHNAAIVEEVYGGGAGVAALIATSRQAELSEQAGQPQVITAASATDRDALMYQVPYYTEENRGLVPEYDNRFNLASWEPWLIYDSVALAIGLDKPLLLVHSNAAAVPQGARQFLENVEGMADELWLDDITQFEFYDRPDVVEIAADAASRHFSGIRAGR